MSIFQTIKGSLAGVYRVGKLPDPALEKAKKDIQERDEKIDFLETKIVELKESLANCISTCQLLERAYNEWKELEREQLQQKTRQVLNLQEDVAAYQKRVEELYQILEELEDDLESYDEEFFYEDQICI